MSTQGPLFVGSGADGTSTWTNPNNVTADDSATADVILPSGNAVPIRCTMATIPFSIPAGNKPTSVLIEIKCDGIDSFGGTVTFTKVQLVSGGIAIGSNLASGSPGSSLAYFSFTQNVDGILSLAQANDSTFGVDISFSDSGGGPGQASIDAVRLTVTYGGPVIVGPKLPDISVGHGHWINPDNALAEDGAFASNDLQVGGGDILSVRMGADHFDVPSDQFVWEIDVAVKCKYIGNGFPEFSLLRLMSDTAMPSILAGGSLGRDDRFAIDAALDFKTYYFVARGLSGPAFPLSQPTVASVNATDFGLDLAVTDFGATVGTVYVDVVEFTLTYGPDDPVSGDGNPAQMNRSVLVCCRIGGPERPY
jgi:hypothetical protein